MQSFNANLEVHVVALSSKRLAVKEKGKGKSSPITCMDRR
jgi:hypothetical protein